MRVNVSWRIHCDRKSYVKLRKHCYEPRTFFHSVGDQFPPSCQKRSNIFLRRKRQQSCSKHRPRVTARNEKQSRYISHEIHGNFAAWPTSCGQIVRNARFLKCLRRIRREKEIGSLWREPVCLYIRSTAQRFEKTASILWV